MNDGHIGCRGSFQGQQPLGHPLGAESRREVRRDVVRIIVVHRPVVARDDIALLRVHGLRHIFEGDVALPFVFAGPARNRQPTVVLRTYGHLAPAQVTEVAIGIDEYQVVARVNPFPHRFDQLVRIFCQQHLPQPVGPGGRPFRRRVLESDTAALLRVSRDNRTVLGDPDLQGNVVAALNFYRLLIHLSSPPLVFVLVVTGVVFLKLFDIEILIICAQVSHAPGHPGIVAEVGERGHPRKR